MGENLVLCHGFSLCNDHLQRSIRCRFRNPIRSSTFRQSLSLVGRRQSRTCEYILLVFRLGNHDKVKSDFLNCPLSFPLFKMEQTPSLPRFFHFRMVSILGALFLVDFISILFFIEFLITEKERSGLIIMFASEVSYQESLLCLCSFS